MIKLDCRHLPSKRLQSPPPLNLVPMSRKTLGTRSPPPPPYAYVDNFRIGQYLFFGRIPMVRLAFLFILIVF